MNTLLNIVGIQAPLFWEQKDKNLNYFKTKIEHLKSDCDIIVLPEMFTSGFTMKPELVAESMEGKTIKWMKNRAKEKNAAIVGSIVIEEEHLFYNRIIFMFPSGKLEYYDKRHPFSMAGEHKVYKAGQNKKIVNYKDWNICLQICYDLRFPVWMRNTENYDLLLVLANWPIPRINAWNTLLKARAIENMVYTVGVNRVGMDANNHEYSGNSMIVDYLGNTISSLQEHEEGIIRATIDKEAQKETRNTLGFLNDRDTFKLMV